ncbi:hypothetical protein WELLINGTON_177 [Erwinia phage Wellington]|jgi:hypothetical protein|uniref:Uncharacterized protein n=2 Tax=Wellingtonvirus wellington TaxID=2734153 RepID=A0A1B2IE32_9CAUD|nr:hypothetical protein BIZ80_gp121 [Erwinia phage vB_EamM_Kwan]YP_009806661.1 hypothetical protein HOT70_gp124 [Erwinia phage Wellington]ANZ49530.1 hypothetical protein KWAN_178 [Erwinia phage vB_EamM_Kwan]AXF51306.1 hypothetical protein WELLINGTON_177 [Erwinia phage Wellington]
MKSLLLQNFTKYDSRKIEAFLQHYKLFNIHAIVPADDFNDHWLRLINRFALNVVLPIQCVENGHDSLAEIEKRNPGFEARILAAPASKVNILRTGTIDRGGDSLVALCLSFPDVPVWMVRNPESACHYFDDMMFMQAFQENDQPLPNLQYRLDLRIDFEIMSYDMLTKVGFVGEKECLVLTR